MNIPPAVDRPSIDPAEVWHRAQELAPQTVERYRWLHRHPELSFQEHDTARFIAETLRAIDGVEEIKSLTPTSVCAAIRGRASRDGGAAGMRVVALRADIDALAIDEQTGLEHASERPGVMHACGHDGHTAILLSVAQLLAELRAGFVGEVRLLFQHAEERMPGGARELVAAGAMRSVEAVVGLHLVAQIPTGCIAASSGPVYASGDMFTIHVEGSGGHGAYPHETVDPVAVGAEIVTNLQHIISRTVDPMVNAVVSVTRFLADNPPSVIPSSVELAGTTRALDAGVHAALLQRLERIATGVAAAHGATAKVAVEEGYPLLLNDARVTAEVRAAIAAGLPDAALIEQLPEMALDDFAVLSSEAPGCYFRLGAGDPAWERSFPHHHAAFRIDEHALPIGVAALAHAALVLLRAGPAG